MQGCCEDKMSYCQVNSSLPGGSPHFTQINVSGSECHSANVEEPGRKAAGTG